MKTKTTNILSLKKCPVSGFPITTNTRWKYIASDNSCSIEMAVIGDNILYELPTGIVNEKANEWFVKTADTIITKHFGDSTFFIIFDYSKFRNANLHSKKIFFKWLLSHSEHVGLITVFGLNKLVKLTVMIGHYISEKSELLKITDSYSSSIKTIIENKTDNKVGTETKSTHVSKIVGYLNRMTWTNDLKQKIPVLPLEDPFASIFASVAANQENLRSLEKDIAKAKLELEKSLKEKEKSLAELKDNELVMLSIMEDVQNQEANTKKALDQAHLIMKGANIGWWDWNIPLNTVRYNDIYAKNLGYKLSNIGTNREWWESKIHPDDFEKTKQDFQTYLRGDTEYYQSKYRLKTKEGVWKWFANFGQIASRDSENRAVRMLGISKDIDIEETAKQALEQSEEYFRTIIENTIDAITVIDINGKIIFQSESAKKILGYTNEESINTLSFSNVHPDDKKQLIIHMNEILQKPNNIAEIKARIFHKDGSIIHIQGTAKNTLHSPAIKGIIINYRDVTERIKSYSLINKLSTAIEQTDNTVVITDAEGIIEYINPQFTKKTGYTAEEVIGKNPRILNSGLQSMMYYVSMWDTIKSGKTWHGEFHNIKKNGELFWEQVTISPIKEEGEIVNFLAIKQDITKQKQLEQKQNEDRYLLKQRLNYISFTNELSAKFINISGHKLKEAINDLLKITSQFTNTDRASLFLIPDDKEIIVLSHEWCNMNAKPHKGIFDSIKLNDVGNLMECLLKGENYQIHASELNDSLTDNYEMHLLDLLGIKSSFNIPIIIKDILQGFISFDTVAENTRWTTENKDSFELCKIIITNTIERIQSEQSLIIEKEKAEESNRLKTSFLNNMSHEIRTPLNGILGFLDIVADPEIEPEEKEEYIEIINRNSQRLITTVTDIIDISKIEAGQIEVNKTKMSINKLIDELYLQFIEEAKSKNIEFTIHTSFSDHQDTLFTDIHKINSILSNLVKNALKYTEKGKITLGYHTKTNKGSRLLEFYVEDTGVGIPQHRIEAIFNRFEQADISNTRAIDGSGLGLAISKAYAKMLDGEIFVSSEENVGSRFAFTLPYKKEGSPKPAKEKTHKRKTKYESFKNLIVLIAEDEEINNLYFKVILKNIFKETIYVKTGQQAIAMTLERPEINLILMDIKMPDTNGYEASKAIRKTNKDVIIIAQTAHGFTGDKEKAMKSGCDDYISKPMDKDDLFDMIDKHFETDNYLISL